MDHPDPAPGATTTEPTTDPTIETEYARLRAAKRHLTQSLTPDARAHWRTAIDEATDRIHRLQRQMQEADTSR